MMEGFHLALLDLSIKHHGKYQLTVYNVIGLRMREFWFNANNGVDGIFSFTHELQPGFYFLVVSDNIGSRETVNVVGRLKFCAPIFEVVQIPAA